MAVTIIVKDGKPRGVTRTKVDEKLRDVWGSTSFRNDEDRHRCEFL